MVRHRARKGTRVAVDEAMKAEDLTRQRDRENVAEGLRAVLDSLPPAPSSPLDAGVRRRIGAAVAYLCRTQAGTEGSDRDDRAR